MSTIKIYDMKGSSVGDVAVEDSMLVLDRGDQAVHETVVAIQAGKRSGSASTKCKGEVAGSGRKPWRQKGTGRARAGYKQSPVWRGGGTVFGPRPRDYSRKVNRKVAALAFRRVLSERIAAGNIKVLDELSVPEPRTKSVSEIMKSLEIKGAALFIVDKIEKNLLLACRNLSGVDVSTAGSVDVYTLLRFPVIVASKDGFEGLKARLNAGGKGE